MPLHAGSKRCNGGGHGGRERESGRAVERCDVREPEADCVFACGGMYLRSAEALELQVDSILLHTRAFVWPGA